MKCFHSVQEFEARFIPLDNRRALVPLRISVAHKVLQGCVAQG